MHFLEKDLEDIIYNSSLTEDGRALLKERGLDIQGKLFRQVNLGGYGRIDLLEYKFTDYPFDRGLTPEIVIYELKRNRIDEVALMQALKYEKGIKRYLWEFVPSSKKKKDVNIFIVLIGEKFSVGNNFPFLYNKLHNVNAYTFSYDIDGLRFNSIGKRWIISAEDENFDLNLAETIAYPSFSELRDILEPNRR